MFNNFIKLFQLFRKKKYLIIDKIIDYVEDVDIVSEDEKVTYDIAAYIGAELTLSDGSILIFERKREYYNIIKSTKIIIMDHNINHFIINIFHLEKYLKIDKKVGPGYKYRNKDITRVKEYKVLKKYKVIRLIF